MSRQVALFDLKTGDNFLLNIRVIFIGWLIDSIKLSATETVQKLFELNQQRKTKAEMSKLS